ncbi:sialin-like [Babylonia areolata]|uniref:sialin-like n=1 Tax=Babylonia areolata TaxID=304850 RepID=UPI003FD04E3B
MAVLFFFEDEEIEQARYVLAFWSFMGFFNMYCQRVSLSVALLAMVNSSQSADLDSASASASASLECLDHSDNTTTNSTGEFQWDEETQGLILGAFYYGYIVTQVPAGWLAERTGAKRLLALGCLLTSVLTLLTPAAARFGGTSFLVAVRVMQGLGQGVVVPAMYAMWAEWAPVYERSILSCLTHAGGEMGTVSAMSVSGVLCKEGFAGGWPSVFYVFGALGCLWVICWTALIHDSPAQHPRISAAERHNIESSIGRRERLSTPWRALASSPAVWAVTIAHFSFNWVFYCMVNCLPTYLKEILHFHMAQAGFLSGVPHLVLLLTEVPFSLVADFIRGRRYLSTGATRKLFYTVGCVLQAALMVGTGYTGCSPTLAVGLVTLGVGSAGFTVPGFSANHLDIAPRFAGTLGGITNTVATIPGFLAPAVVGILTNDNQTLGQWRIVFFITAAISLSSVPLFLLLGKGEEQSWAAAPERVYTPLPSSRTNAGHASEDINDSHGKTLSLTC